MPGERDAASSFDRRVDAEHWAGLARGELLVQRCPQCAFWSWPADWRCAHCGSYDRGWEQVEARGVVYSWIRTHLPFAPAFADLVPYVNVLVELPQAGGARLMGLLTGDDHGIAVGRSLQGTFRAPEPRTLDLPVITWELVP